MINILISGLFACSIFFGWVLAVQIMLGILFFLFAIFTVIKTICNLFNNRKYRRKNDKLDREFMQERIKNMREYLEQVKQTSKQSKNDESAKKIRSELGGAHINSKGKIKAMEMVEIKIESSLS